VIEFSAKLAEFVLTELNDKNRPMKPAKIRLYANDLAGGMWGLTGDTVNSEAMASLRMVKNRLLRLCGRISRSGPTSSLVLIRDSLPEWT